MCALQRNSPIHYKRIMNVLKNKNNMAQREWGTSALSTQNHRSFNSGPSSTNGKGGHLGTKFTIPTMMKKNSSQIAYTYSYYEIKRVLL